MQKQILILTSLAVFSLAACDNVAKGTKTEANEAAATTQTSAAAENFQIDLAASKITWEGTKPTGKHTGTIALKAGAIASDKGTLSGVFDLDMNAINCTDLTAKDGKGDLEEHLKSADFFDIAKFPTAKFEITKMESATDASTITGNLTMKGVTKSISFAAKTSEANGALTIDAPAFVINRLDWGIKTGSKSLAATTKDKVIGDDIGIMIHLVAKK